MDHSRRILQLVVLAALIGLTIWWPAESDAKIRASLDEIARVMTTYFPKLDGKVLSVEDQAIKIDLGREQGVLSGMVLRLYRTGEVFLHPITKEPLGRFEQELGRVVVIQVDAKTSVVKIAGPVLNGGPKVGDGVRLTGARLPVAVLPGSSTTNHILLQEFSAALKDTGRFKPLSPEAIAEATLMKPKPDQARPGDEKRPAVELDLDYLLRVTSAPGPGGTEMSVKILTTQDDKPLVTLEAVVDLSSEMGLAFLEESQLSPVQMNPKQSTVKISLPFEAKHLVLADMDKDGKPEWILSDGNKIRIYHLVKNKPEMVWEEKEKNRGNQHLALDAVDLNQDGFPELFVTNMLSGNLDSYVIEWKDGQYLKTVKHLPYFLRVWRSPGKPPKLLAQRTSLTEPFAGPIHEMTWTGSGLVEGPVFSMPSGVGLYGSAAADLNGDGTEEFIQVDDDEHLRVFGKNGKLLIRSPERYGGYENGFEHVSPETVQIAQEKRDFVKVKGRIEFMRNPQGGLWIVVTKNIPVTYLVSRSRGYRDSEVYGLSLQGAGSSDGQAEFSEDWKIKAPDQVISDIQLSDVMGQGQPQVVLLLRPGLGLSTLSSFFSRESELRIYRIPSEAEKHGTK
jgi:hypothetical protein